MGNTLGKLLTLTTFGESHGPAIGGVIDGFPSGFTPDVSLLQKRMAERKPGSSPAVSARNETDEVEILSGIFEGETLGTPIGFIIRNKDCRSGDYDALRDAYRPGHADLAYRQKYGHRDWRGGGRASARATAPVVFAGALASQWLALYGIAVETGTDDDLEAKALEAKAEGDSIGGMVSCRILGLPSGIGEPLFDKLQATLGHALLGINAVKGVEFGMGFAAAGKRGSEILDSYTFHDGSLHSVNNFDGGLSGGISTGEEISFRVAFKPTPTFPNNDRLYTDKGKILPRDINGRHDPCVALRGQYVVRAVTEFVLMDAILIRNAYK